MSAHSWRKYLANLWAESTALIYASISLWSTMGFSARLVRLRVESGVIMLEGVLHTCWEAEYAAHSVRRVIRGMPVKNHLATWEGTGTGDLGREKGPDGEIRWRTLAAGRGVPFFDSPGLPDAVLHHLLRDALLIAQRIETVEEAPGVIALIGEVPSRFHRDLAETLTRRHAGVRAVRNDLRIDPRAFSE